MSFPPTSRYFGIETAVFTRPDRRKAAYLRRRFLPPPGGAVLAEHLVTEGERLDNITARYLGDPEQFWRVADANNTMHPDELTDAEHVGHRLRIPLPQAG